MGVSVRDEWTCVTLFSVAATALNGKQTHYNGLPQEDLIRNKSVRVNKVYSKSGRVHMLLDTHTYTYTYTFKIHPSFSPDLVSTRFVTLQQCTNGAFL